MRITCPSGVYPLVEAENITSLVELGGSQVLTLITEQSILVLNGNDTSEADIKGFFALDQTRSLLVVAFASSGNTICN